MRECIFRPAILAVIVFALTPCAAFGQDLVLIPPDSLDFYRFYEGISRNYCYCCLWPEEPTEAQRAMNPDIADINGGAGNPETGVPTGNGMLDTQYEMAMIAQILKAPPGWKITGPYGAGADRDQMTEAWNGNIPTFLYDLGNLRHAVIEGLRPRCYETGNIAGFMFAIMGAILLIGDQGSNAFFEDTFRLAAEYGFTTDFSPSHYRSFPHLLGPEGDADRDGYSNRQEYVAFGPGAKGSPSAFLSAVLDPNIKPEGTPLNTDDDQDGLTNDREDLNLNGVVDPGESDPLNPDSDGDGLGDAVEVLQWGSDPLSASDCPQVPAIMPVALVVLGLVLGAQALRRVARG